MRLRTTCPYLFRLKIISYSGITTILKIPGGNEMMTHIKNSFWPFVTAISVIIYDVFYMILTIPVLLILCIQKNFECIKETVGAYISIFYVACFWIRCTFSSEGMQRLIQWCESVDIRDLEWYDFKQLAKVAKEIESH